MSVPQLISVGYEGRDADAVVDALQSQGARVLVDVRMTPISRKPGLSKQRLAEALRERGISYVHHRELGNPKDNREAFRAGYVHAHTRFRGLLTSHPAVRALKHVAELLDDEGTVALFCFERDHAECHRRLIAEALMMTNPSLGIITI